MRTYEWVTKTGGRFLVVARRPLKRIDRRDIEREVCAASSTCITRKEAPHAPVD